jgi:3-oxoacyl-[acyl-carrier protein] reductase
MTVELCNLTRSRAMEIGEEIPADSNVIRMRASTRNAVQVRVMVDGEEQMWDEVMDTNLKSAFALIKAAQRPMMKARSGSIINVTSVVGITGNAGQANYAASKAGMIGLTKSVAKELGSRNIRCNAIAPGFIETEMTEALAEEVRAEWVKGIPLKRGGTPEDVANTVLYLASDLSAYVSGQTICVDGGMVMQ